MDFNELKKVLDKVGSVVVLRPDGSKMVVLSFEKFQEIFSENEEETKIKLIRNFANGNGSSDQGTIEKLNKDIAALKEDIRRREIEELGEVD